MKILILHISDIHLREEHQNPSIPKFGFIAPALQNEEHDLTHVVVAISGDVAYAGKKSEYELAKKCLDSLTAGLQERLKVEKVRYVLIPGNHDCDFSGNNRMRMLAIEAVRNGEAPDDEMIDSCCKPQAEFVKFRDSHPNAKPDHQSSPLHWQYRIEDVSSSIEFRCFNTAWMSVLHETQGTLHVPDLVADHEDSSNGSDYVVSLFHHPYNWMPSATFRRFKTLVEESSDLVLTGHEHEADHFQKYSFKSQEVNDYLEGAVFQENDRDDRAGFHAVFVDLIAQRQRTVSFTWEEQRFAPESIEVSWVPYKRGSRGGKREFDLSEEFAKSLEDPGASYQHPAKPDLRLADIYVFPNLKQFEISKKTDFVYGSLIEGRDVLKTLGSKRKVLLFGRQQSGKTTLAKVLFTDLYNKNLTPVLISGDDLTKAHLNSEKLDTLVETQFAKQYRNPNLPAFDQVDKDKAILIVDDFDHGALNSAGRLKLLEVATKRYDRLVVFADDIIKLEELAVYKEGSDVLTDFEQFEIVQFGHLLRSKLITQWYSIGSEYDADPIELGKRIHIAEQMVSTMLGKNYLPHFPVFILTLIQASDSAAHPNTSAGTYGSLYEIIITQALASKSSNVDLDTKMTYLSEIAHWMHAAQKKRITDDEWEYFHRIYCKKFKIHPSKESIKRDFATNGLFDLRDERYGFRHPASYYYFVARYFRDNLSKDSARTAVAGLLSKLYKEEHASIWLFLTHLSKDPFLLETILEHAKRIYSEFPSARFEEDVSFLQALADSVEKIVLKDKSLGESKEERLRTLDALPALPDTSDDFDGGEDETNETLKLIAKMNLALRTLEVLGQLVKNFPGSLQGDDKLALVQECYALGLRTISMLFGLFQSDVEAFVDCVYERLIEKHSEIDDRDELKSKVRKFMFWMIESASFGMIKRIAQAVGHSQLGEIYREVREQDESNATALIDIAIHLENLGFPEDRLKELAQKFLPQISSPMQRPASNSKYPVAVPRRSKNLFCEQILKQLVVEHFYLFPTRESTKQKICAALQIEVQKIRHLDVKAENERRAPQSSLPDENQ
ncbi:MAG: metallophosphoesterase [Chthoniobacterales bacterium]